MISRYSLFVVVVLCLLQTTLVVAVFPGGRYRFNDEASFQRTQDTPCECMLVQAHALYLNSSQAKPDITGGWRCVIKEAIYEFQDGLPNGLIEKLQSEDSTKATMQISSCNIVVNNDEVSTRTELFGRSSVVPDVGGNRIKIDPNATITVTRNNNERRRSLQGGTPLPDDPTGKHVTVVVRVSGNDVAPAKSAAEIADDFFTDPMNLRSQYKACSGNKIDFVPATGQGIVNGVVEISLNKNLDGKTQATVAGWAFDEFLNKFGTYDPYVHIVYCLPKEVNFGTAAAIGYVGWKVTVFNGAHTATLLVQVHEVGHNLGLMHSGQNGVEYQDTTCMMGAHRYTDDGPQMCFNGAKSWYLGWYADKGGHVTLSSPASWHGKLAGIDDYLNSQTIQGEHNVITKILLPGVENDPKGKHLYVMFNRQEGVNAGVVGSGDKVTIVEQGGKGGQSWLLASLDESSSSFSIANWDGSKALFIEVCELVMNGTPDYARVLVYLDTGGSRLTCSSPLTTATQTQPAPTPKPVASTPQPVAPTSQPVLPTPQPVPPTPRPTGTPSDSPSDSPSTKPSASPSVSISSAPSASPSYHPSLRPTASKQPSSTPSIAPSSEPSVSAAPSTQPSISSEPSLTPSVQPTGQPSNSVMPSSNPSESPTDIPSSNPTIEPSAMPSTSSRPSDRPSLRPSARPTTSPTTSFEPTNSPSLSAEPSNSPTATKEPSSSPSTEAPSNPPQFFIRNNEDLATHNDPPPERLFPLESDENDPPPARKLIPESDER